MMPMSLKAALVATVLTSSLAHADTVNFIVDVYPPFITRHGQETAGPMIESVKLLLAHQHIEPVFEVMPTSRILRVLPQSAKTCAFAIPFDPSLAETVIYLARVAPITLSVFSARKDMQALRNVEELRGYQIGALDIAEIRDLLDSHGIRYFPIRPEADATRMLLAHRFDLLISDSEMEIQRDSNEINKVMTLARVERWLACEKSMPPATLSALRTALKEGVFPPDTRSIWDQQGLGDFYNGARKAWGLTPN